MSQMNCLDDDTLFTLVDEPEAATAAAAHVVGCASCAARKRELEQIVGDMRGDVDTHAADALVERLTQKVQRKRSARVLYGAASVLALAATILLGPRLFRADTFDARGGGAHAQTQVELALDVVRRPAGGSVTLSPAADIATTSDAHLLLSYGTRALTTPSYVLCFAVDAAGDVHWLYPAYENAASDPASIELRAGRELAAMPTEALLDEVKPGKLQVFALISNQPLHVSEVERLAPSELARANLERRFLRSDVRTWNLEISRHTK